jgi:formylmethanofuran:tetrahydromethanopterin formyltransferase
MENDKAIEYLYDISTDAIYCITTEESEAIQTSINAIKKLEKIEQILADYDGTIVNIVKQFSEIQKVMKQE